MWDRKPCIYILCGFYWLLSSYWNFVTWTLQNDLFLIRIWRVRAENFWCWFSTISMSESAKFSRVLSLISVIHYQCVLRPDLMTWDYKRTWEILNDIIVSAVTFMNIWDIHSFFMIMNLSIPKWILVPCVLKSIWYIQQKPCRVVAFKLKIAFDFYK